MTRSTAIHLALLCLLTGTTWLLDAALPSALPGALGLLVNSAVLAVAFFLAGRANPASPAPILTYLALLLAVPGALASLADGRLSSTTIVLIYTIVPAATVFFAAQTQPVDFLRLLGPSLAGLAGAALILPFALPASVAGTLWFTVMVLSALAAAYAGLRLHTLLAGASPTSIATLAAAASALVALPLYLRDRPTLVLLTWPQALLSETAHLAFLAATLLLTVRLLRDAPPIALSTRFFLIPLVTIAEGYFLLHPTATWTLPAGLLLLAGGSLVLLRAPHQA